MRRFTRTLLLVVLNFLAISGRVTAWEVRVGGGRANSVTVDGSGDVVAVGTTGGDFTVIKFSGATATQLWRKEIAGTAGGGEANAVKVDVSGDVIAAGRLSNTDTASDFTVIKFSGATGAELWRKEVAGTTRGFDNAASVTVDGSGDVIAAGVLIRSFRDFTVIKFSGATGVELWRQEIDGTASDFDDQAVSVTVDGSGDVIAAGMLENTGSGTDFAVIKFSGATGVELWRQEIDGTCGIDDVALAVTVDGSGDVIAAGSIEPLFPDFAVVKFSGTTGVELWRQVIEGLSAFDRAVSVTVDGSGDVIAAGEHRRDFTVIKFFGATGTELWRKRVDASTRLDQAVSVTVDGSGDVIAVGTLKKPINDDDFTVIKFSEATGAELWRHEIDGGANRFDKASSVTVDGSGDVIAVGSLSTGPSSDFTVIKFRGTDGCRIEDCNGNEVCDDRDIASGTSLDCNDNKIPDECDIAGGTSLDCNANGVPDACDLAMDFTSPDSYTVGSLPEFLTAAKMDGDDRIDLVVPNFASDTISLLINAGGGMFHGAVNVATGNGPTFVTAAQLDNVGGTDVAVANQLAGDVRVLRNFAGGSFASSETYAVGSEPTSVAAADLDNDHHRDLAVANFSSDSISILFNDGTGLFQAGPAPLTAGPSPAVVTAADVDGDGLLDLVAANNVSSGTVSVFRNLGNQSFDARFTCPVGSRPYTVIAADLNGDGDVDLATANTTSRISVLLNTGGTGCPFDTVTYAVGATQHAVAAADINNDGHLDLAFANFDTGDVGVLENRGDGTFSATEALSFQVQAGLLGLAAADLDGDDLPDIAVSRRAGAGGLSVGRTISVLLNGTTSFDCNSNGIPDECDIASGTSQDTNSNGRADACEPFLLPGDCNQDSALDLSDALCGLGVLFTGNPPLFPCGDGTPTDPGNIALIDWQPDGSIDLSDVLGLLQFLFFSADAHSLAVPGAETTECVPIAGCSNNSNCP